MSLPPSMYCLGLMFVTSAAAQGNCEWESGDTLDAQVESCVYELRENEPDHPASACAYTIHAEAWSEKGEFDCALRESEKAVELAPRDTKARSALCLALLNKAQWRKAIAECSFVIERGSDPDVWTDSAYTRRGAAWALAGDLEKSIADSTAAINDRSARAYYNRGLAWLRKGEYEKALADYQAALDANPADPRHWLKHPAAWATMSVAERTATLFAGLDFSGIMTTSPTVARVWNVHESRFGTVLEVGTREHPHPNSTLLVDGVKVFEALQTYLHFEGLFELGDTDALLFGLGCGGNSCAPDPLVLVLLRADHPPAVINPPTLVSGDHTLAAHVDGQRLLLDLGFEGGKRKSAELHNGQVSVTLQESPAGVVPRICALLYEMSARNCTDRQFGCDRAIPIGGNMDVKLTTHASRQPGYSRAALMSICNEVCKTGVMIEPGRYAREVCGYSTPPSAVFEAIETEMKNAALRNGK